MPTTGSSWASPRRSKPAARARRRRRRKPASARPSRSWRCSRHTIDLAKLAEESNHRPLRLRVGQLIDGESNQPRREVDIVFDAKEIHSVGAPEGQADATLAE